MYFPDSFNSFQNQYEQDIQNLFDQDIHIQWGLEDENQHPQFQYPYENTMAQTIEHIAGKNQGLSPNQIFNLYKEPLGLMYFSSEGQSQINAESSEREDSSSSEQVEEANQLGSQNSQNDKLLPQNNVSHKRPREEETHENLQNCNSVVPFYRDHLDENAMTQLYNNACIDESLCEEFLSRYYWYDNVLPIVKPSLFYPTPFDFEKLELKDLLYMSALYANEQDSKNLILKQIVSIYENNTDDSCALMEIGTAYLKGWGVSIDLSTGVSYLSMAASKGNGRAQLLLGKFIGYCIFKDPAKYTKKNLLKAIKLLKRASVQGYKEADKWIGKIVADDRSRALMPQEAITQAQGRFEGYQLPNLQNDNRVATGMDTSSQSAAFQNVSLLGNYGGASLQTQNAQSLSAPEIEELKSKLLHSENKNIELLKKLEFCQAELSRVRKELIFSNIELSRKKYTLKSIINLANNSLNDNPSFKRQRLDNPFPGINLRNDAQTSAESNSDYGNLSS